MAVQATPELVRLALPGMLACRACPDLLVSRRMVVPGYGQIPSPIMFIAEAPGYNESRKGFPMVGDSGQLHDRALKAAGLPLTYFKTNVCLCRPPNNRVPTPRERSNCDHWLIAQIERVDPQVIVALGGTAYRSFLPDEPSGITDIRGNPFKRVVAGKERIILPTVHPAFVGRNEAQWWSKYVDDLRHAKRLLEQGLQEMVPFNKVKSTWAELFAAIESATTFGFDLETAGPETKRHRPISRKAEIVGVGVCVEPGKTLYVPCPDHDAEMLANIERLREPLENAMWTKAVSNVNFERHVMANYGITMVNYKDTLLEAWLLGDVPLALKDAFHRQFGHEMIRIQSVMGVGKHQRDMRTATYEDEDDVVEYAAQDPDATLRLHRLLYPALQERGVASRLYDMELEFAEAIFEMERTGISFDGSALTEAAAQLDVAIEETGAHCNTLAGIEWSPTSHDQAAAVLFGWKKPLPVDKKPGKTVLRQNELASHIHDYRIAPVKGWERKGSSPPTDKVTLAGDIGNPLVRGMLSLRAQKKLKSTYIEGLPRFVEEDGRIHTSINQLGAGTGRVSSSDPNLQNIPARPRDDVDLPFNGGLIRRAFVAGPDNWLYCPDLSQIEMRVMAHLSGDEAMIAVLTDPNGDIHDNTTKGIFQSSLEEYLDRYGYELGAKRWKDNRYIAKTIGFGVLYGLTAPGLLLRTPTLKLTLQEAAAFIEGFYNTYPKVRLYQDYVKRFVRENGYFESLLGRRRYFPDITSTDNRARAESENAAINMPVQGGAADYFKLATNAVKRLRDENRLATRLVLQVHDEIVLEGPKTELPTLIDKVFPVMAEVYPLKVPVRYDVEGGPSWGEQYKGEELLAMLAA